jgi:hypothetical protein
MPHRRQEKERENARTGKEITSNMRRNEKCAKRSCLIGKKQRILLLWDKKQRVQWRKKENSELCHGET